MRRGVCRNCGRPRACGYPAAGICALLHQARWTRYCLRNKRLRDRAPLGTSRETARNEADLWGRTSRSSGPLACMVKIVRCSANRSRTRALQTHPPTLWAIHREPEPPRPDGPPRCALARRGRGEIGERRGWGTAPQPASASQCTISLGDWRCSSHGLSGSHQHD